MIMSIRILIASSFSAERGQIIKLISHLKNLELVTQATTVQEAIAMYHEFKPNAIVLDHKLIGGNAMDVLELTKEEIDQKPITIVIADSLTPQVKQQYLRAGTNYALDKAIEFNEILEVLKSVDFQC